jgi:hypothetical protein
MAFADDLLEQAYHLARREKKQSRQASLRRAVSTVYYALFHLLIDEAVANWGIERQRAILARTFEHGKMKSVCQNYLKDFQSAGRPPSELPLANVAEAFIALQRQRHIADYDIGFNWTQTNAIELADVAAAAFGDWRSIRNTEVAQDFLLNLFLPKPPRQ